MDKKLNKRLVQQVVIWRHGSSLWKNYPLEKRKVDANLSPRVSEVLEGEHLREYSCDNKGVKWGKELEKSVFHMSAAVLPGGFERFSEPEIQLSRLRSQALEWS